MGDDYERVLCVKNEVFVYKIPPRQSARGYRAADWKLDQPDWTARLRIIVINNRCIIKFEDKVSGELFAQAPVDVYPGPVIEAVSDSSRYFVIKIQDESGRHAFIGMGFADRGDSFDFNVSLQDHFKREKTEEEISKEDIQAPHVDLKFKEGQTIKINFGHKTDQESTPRHKPGGSGNIGFIPPPPGGGAPKLAPPPGSGAPLHTRPVQTPPQQKAQHIQANEQKSSEWGDFTSFSSSNSSNENTNWVQF